MTNLTRSLQIFLWSYAFVFVVICSLQVNQVDLWYQLAEGFHILETWTLPTAPAAAYGLPATPYFDEYAGYEIVLATLFKMGGFTALWMAFAMVYLGILFLPFGTSGRKYPAFDFSTTAALLVAAILMTDRMEQRPELVGGFFLVILMAILRRSLLEKITARTMAGVFALFLAWTNTHSSFVIGFFTLGLWIACEFAVKFRNVPVPHLLRNAAALGIAALLATMLNPYGPRRLLFPFAQASDFGSTALSPEMWPVDFNTLPGEVVLLAILFLLWGLATTRGVPLWLILFSVFSVFISLKGFRFINYLAIALLFVYSARAEKPSTAKRAFPLWLRLLNDAALCLFCVFLIFGDAFGYIYTYTTHREGIHSQHFAEDICALKVAPPGKRVPVLCGHGMGSYLSFGDTQFRPLLDSGLSHFSDETKRYFFFLWREPDALALALHKLDVNYVLIDRYVYAWILTMQRLPDWEFVMCTPDGMLWKRNANHPHTLTAAERTQIETAKQELIDSGEIGGAFTYSTLVDSPATSLAILSGCGGREWPEAFFTSVCAWVDAQPPAALEEYLSGNHSRAYPLVDAIVAERLGPNVFDKFVATHPTGPRPWYWKALEVRNCLRKGEVAQGRAIFNSISPVPASSVTYYELRHELQIPVPSAYGQWQTWDDSAKKFEDAMSSRLNSRISELSGRPGS